MDPTWVGYSAIGAPASSRLEHEVGCHRLLHARQSEGLTSLPHLMPRSQRWNPPGHHGWQTCALSVKKQEVSSRSGSRKEEQNHMIMLHVAGTTSSEQTGREISSDTQSFENTVRFCSKRQSNLDYLS
eukprot:761252-Hanusia_phi.AAC.3